MEVYVKTLLKSNKSCLRNSFIAKSKPFNFSFCVFKSFTSKRNSRVMTYFNNDVVINSDRKSTPLLSKTLTKETENSDLLSINKIVTESPGSKKFLDRFDEKNFLNNKEKTFSLNRDDYKMLIEKEVKGEVKKFTLNGKEVFLIGTAYDLINPTNIYKLLNSIKPDLILLQLRPDKFLSGIQQSIEKFLCNKMTDEELTNVFIRNPWEIQPSIQSKEEIKEKLKSDKVFLNLEKKVEEREVIELKQKNYIETNDLERISKEVTSVISLWGEQKEVQILPCNVPEYLQYESIANNHTTTELNTMLKEIYNTLAKGLPIEPNTSIGVAYWLYPEIFLNKTNGLISQYLSVITNKDSFANISQEEGQPQITNQKALKKIAVFVGHGQVESIPLFVKYDKDRNSLKKIYEIPKKYESIVFGSDSLEVLIDKWTSLELIFKGPRMFKKSSINPTINHLLDKYVREERISSGFNNEAVLKERSLHLFQQLYKEKMDRIVEYSAEGFEVKKKEYLKKIFKDPFLNSQLN